MKRLVLSIVFSFLLGLIIPLLLSISIFPPLTSTLYTVAGILFSVGMSIVVTMSTQNIRNVEAKKEVQIKIHSLLKEYVEYFVVLTLYYVLMPSVEDKSPYSDFSFVIGGDQIVWSYSLSFVAFTVFQMSFFIYNMFHVRMENNEIERIIDSEYSQE